MQFSALSTFFLSLTAIDCRASHLLVFNFELVIISNVAVQNVLYLLHELHFE